MKTFRQFLEGIRQDQDAALQASLEAHKLSHIIPSPESDDGYHPPSKLTANTALWYAEHDAEHGTRYGGNRNASIHHNLAVQHHNAEGLTNPVHASMHHQAAKAHQLAAAIHNDIHEEQ